MKQVFMVTIIILMVLFTHARSNTTGRQSATLIKFAHKMEQPKLAKGPIGKGGEVIVVIGGKTILSLNEADCAPQLKLGMPAKKRYKVYDRNGKLLLNHEFGGGATTLSTHMLVTKEILVVLEVGSCQTATTVVL